MFVQTFALSYILRLKLDIIINQNNKLSTTRLLFRQMNFLLK